MRVSLEMNPYLLGCIVLMGFWLLTLIFLKRKRLDRDLREFWWASFGCALLGFTEPLFVPEYWEPPSVWFFYRWDIESYIFCFAVGGIAAVLTELPNVKGILHQIDYFIWLVVRRVFLTARNSLLPESTIGNVAVISYSPTVSSTQVRLENMLLITFFLAIFGTTAQFNLNIIYDAAIVCVATALFISWRRPKLRWQIIGGGISFTLIYAVVLTIVGLFYPDFYIDHWQLDALSGLWVGDAPIEEYLFALTFGKG